MKRIYCLFFILNCCCGLMFGNNDALIQKIQNTNGGHKSASCPFTQSKHLKMMEKSVDSKGTLYVMNDKMSMIYSEPAGDFLVINGDKFVMNVRGRLIEHNVKEGSPMRILRNTLLLCMKCDIKAIAAETKSEISYNGDGKYHEFTITRKEKVTRGYSKVILSLDKKDLSLKIMNMEEPNGNYTIYELGKTIYNSEINQDVFLVPVKKK